MSASSPEPFKLVTVGQPGERCLSWEEIKQIIEDEDVAYYREKLGFPPLTESERLAIEQQTQEE